MPGGQPTGHPAAGTAQPLATAAEVLDYFAQQQNVHHLGLNPRTLLLAKHRLQLADFGLAHLLWVPAGQPVAERNARYSAPELFAKQVSVSCDQYSLALIYHELLTGVPVPLSQTRQAGKRGGKPDLSQLPPKDRNIIARLWISTRAGAGPVAATSCRRWRQRKAARQR